MAVIAELRFASMRDGFDSTAVYELLGVRAYP
jgi:hypothetical protein